MALFKKKKVQSIGDNQYLTLREERKIAKENARITRAFEKKKNRTKVPESE